MDETEYRQPTDDDELSQALALRREIFIDEEGRDRLVESDDYDLTAHHIIAVRDRAVVGTLRLYLLNPTDTDIKIGRVAVKKDMRREGIGRSLMEAAHQWAGAQFDSIYLHAQVQMVGFYEKFGYACEGGVFMESGTEHIVMRRLPEAS